MEVVHSPQMCMCLLQHVVSHHRRLQIEHPYSASTSFSCSSEQTECLRIMIHTTDCVPVLHLLHTMKVFIPIYSVTLHLTVIPVHLHKQLGTIQSGGVEVQGVRASTIAKRRNVSKPVLEKYVFTPYIEPTHLDLHTSLRACTHIALENKPGIQVNVVEVHNQGTTPLSPALVHIFADLPLLKASEMPFITQF